MGRGRFGFNGGLTRLAGQIPLPKSLPESQLQRAGKPLKNPKRSAGPGVFPVELFVAFHILPVARERHCQVSDR
jgi:hypothetical protein